jgi:hypothetical protein
MTPKEIAEARELIAKATKGPWNKEGPYGGEYWVDSNEGRICDVVYDGDADCYDVHDAAFIAAARTGWPAALDALEEVQHRTCTRRKLVLCGSTRFKAAWQEWNARLTLDGYVVLSVAMWSHSDVVKPTDAQKILLDAIHFSKIDDSDEVFVLDVGGYIGYSTSREIAHAEKTGKPVRYLSKEYPEWTEADCKWWQPSQVESSLAASDAARVRADAELAAAKGAIGLLMKTADSFVMERDEARKMACELASQREQLSSDHGMTAGDYALRFWPAAADSLFPDGEVKRG